MKINRSMFLFWVTVLFYCIYFAGQHFYVAQNPYLKALVEFNCPDSCALLVKPRVLVFALCHAFCWLVAPCGVGTVGAMHLFFVGCDALCLLGAVLCLFNSVQAEFRKRWLSCATVALFLMQVTAIFLLPRSGLNFFAPYDIPAIFFTSLVLYLTVTRKPLWTVALVVAVGTLNRESMLFSILMVMILRWEPAPKLKRVFFEAMALFLLWGLVKSVASSLTVKPEWRMEMLRWNFFADGAHLLRAVRNISIFWQLPLLPIKLMVTVGFMWLLAFWSAIKIPHRFARCAWVIVPIAAISFLVGNYDEVRIFGETAVFACVACAALIERKVSLALNAD